MTSTATRPLRLVGRDDALRDVADALDLGVPVTLVGPGGVGKTTLARAVARGRPHAVWVDLAGVETAAQVDEHVRRAASSSAGSARDALAELGSRPSLVVLDNAEHVLDAVRTVVDAAPRGTALQLLTTSRLPLDVPDEVVRPVEPLGPDAGELFLARYAARRGAAAAAALDHAVVTSLCARVDGLPLAVELAAAQAARLSPQDVLRALDASGPDVLTGSGGRHRSLSSALALSWQLLDEDAARALRAVSLLAGAFDLDAAAAVTGLPDPSAAVAALVDASLVVSHGDGTYALLQTTRDDARQRLAASDELGEVGARHARWVRERVRLPVEQRPWSAVTTHAPELLDELQTAVTWACAGGDRGLVAEAVADCARELVLRLRVAELDDWVAALTEPTSEGIDPVTETWLVLARATALGRLRDPAGERRLVERGAALAERADEPALVATARFCRLNVALDAGDAETILREGAQLEAVGYANPLLPHHMALAHLSLRDARAALQVSRTAVDRARRSGSPGLLLKALAVQLRAEVAFGSWEVARPLVQESLVLARDEGVRSSLQYVLAALALAIEETGDDALAEEAAAHALAGDAMTPGEPLALRLRERGLGGAPPQGTLDSLVATCLPLVDELPEPSGTRLAAAAPLPLTTRQLEALRAVADGRTSAAAARALGVAPRTLDKHLENAYAALGVSSRIEALAVLREAGALPDLSAPAAPSP